MYLKGDFQEKDAAAQALWDLKSEGFSSADLDVFSDEPVEFPRGVLDRPSHMSLTVVTGAITLCLLTIGFVYYTQYGYPLVTGGMPIFSFWATGVIFYELTMLGSILTTLACFLWESGLLQRRRPPAPVIEPGIICIRVHCPADQAEKVSRCLTRAGARDVGGIGDRNE
jgi:hypothetical protein